MANINILSFINLIRGNMPFEGAELGETSIEIVTEVFTQGNCGNFAQALQIAFGGQVVFAEHHLLCLIEGRLYDINGDVTHKFPTYRYARISELEDMTNNYSFDNRGCLS